ncbi:glycine--tRNA ligase subunit beta [candidate division WOR-1 bacterium RIFOXYA12_FULL_43_27]|uniref:Glycine--tRNA ligase beta subunit n=1 Tax=candidate division WOR-1 bacterium RIFOXYC2_FULL_46_14 TaxID=1802587 RepID=A0A1F4U409_UNCSA|nr:MAG: glycine--tRNA ligase subunit beta [candidate division WOR-1 bacterium RIFOXYA12_FULL_43_27]OGC20918.1 MAG: glycine--tRNA ligase subunit beta [candidate division WOR-1 bacterium RIFOXYB2_FULL_46_45]OGC32322.1 MAG: glycine--tRNA ligase subunit beta [candidate division WOR-1 bacterium RIFOXYA2_FULL_46_56]OGC39621.1 MAG: glycine--tRNA ligase subunit beta [candidate division WOR-1 bacterium RIFOXYC2_FULL_46_14]
MNNLLLEIVCEEIPARFMPALIEDLKNKSAQELSAARIAYSKIETFGTCRRLVLSVEALAPKQEDLVSEMKGPPFELAERAAAGFARSAGVDVNKLVTKDFNGKKYLVAKISRKGEATEGVLKQLLPHIISSLYLPISMRWGDLDFRFIRPIHRITAFYGKKAVRFELAGVKSESAKRKVQSAKIIVDQNNRKELIRKLIQKAEKHVLIDEELLNEVNYLVEYPSVLVGKFKAEYLKLPREVLITSMKKNQRYFPVTIGRDLSLEPRFVVVTDGAAKKYHKNIRAGNEKVLSARLEDARFFFEEDLKIPLKDRIADLKKISFFEKLGNMEEKTERIKKLAEFIVKSTKIDHGKIPAINRIAALCKADLTTKMVFEFPELQGVMGREYALLGGESPVVAEGILEHYSVHPKSIEGAVVGLADKLDTLVGCFSIGYEPSGSTDPYGLRRAAQGVISTILDHKIPLGLEEIAPAAVLNFIAVRLKNLLLEKGYKHDIVDAALSGFNDILDASLRAEALQKTRNASWFEGVRMSGDRVKRISKEASREQVKEHDLTDVEEKALYEAYMKINWEVEEAINNNRYIDAIKKLADLTEPVTLFFDKVLVMHKDERLKVNRLALLKSISSLYLRIADFGRLTP